MSFDFFFDCLLFSSMLLKVHIFFKDFFIMYLTESEIEREGTQAGAWEKEKQVPH